MQVDIIETAFYPQSFCIVKDNAFRKKNVAEQNTVMEALGNLNNVFCMNVYGLLSDTHSILQVLVTVSIIF